MFVVCRLLPLLVYASIGVDVCCLFVVCCRCSLFSLSCVVVVCCCVLRVLVVVVCCLLLFVSCGLRFVVIRVSCFCALVLSVVRCCWSLTLLFVVDGRCLLCLGCVVGVACS